MKRLTAWVESLVDRFADRMAERIALEVATAVADQLAVTIPDTAEQLAGKFMRDTIPAPLRAIFGGGR